MFKYLKRDTTSGYRKPRLTKYDTGEVVATLNYERAIEYYRSRTYRYRRDLFNSLIKTTYEEIEDDLEFIKAMTSKSKYTAIAMGLTSAGSVGKTHKIDGLSDGYVNIIIEDSNFVDILTPDWKELRPIKIIYSKDYDLTMTHPSMRGYKGYMVIKVDLPMLMYQYRSAKRVSDVDTINFLYRYPYLNTIGNIFDLAILNNTIYGGKLTEHIKQPIDRIPVLSRVKVMIKRTNTKTILPYYRKLDNRYLFFTKLTDYTDINITKNSNTYWIFNLVYLNITRALFGKEPSRELIMNRNAVNEVKVYVAIAINNRTHYRNKYVKNIIKDIINFLDKE